MRYSFEFKLECIDKYRQGLWPTTPNGIEKDFLKKEAPPMQKNASAVLFCTPLLPHVQDRARSLWKNSKKLRFLLTFLPSYAII